MKNDDDDFRQQCERNLQRSVEERMRYGFCYLQASNGRRAMAII